MLLGIRQSVKGDFRILRYLVGVLLIGVLLGPLPGLMGGTAIARVSPWAQTGEGSVRLVSTAEAVGDAATIPLGLHFRLAEGWKIYWRSPGEAGYPPQIDWTGSTNVKDITIAWPAPTRFSIFGIETLGYKDEVVLPLTLTPAMPGEAIRLRAVIDYLTCDELCVPARVELALDLPRGPADPAASAGLIGRYLARVPSRKANADPKIVSMELVDTGTQTVLKVAAIADRPFAEAGLDLYVEGPDSAVFGKPRLRLDAERRSALLRVPVSAAFPGDPVPDLVGASLVLTLVDGERAVETRLPVAPGKSVFAFDTLLVILAFAYLGGLILNLMPCVLPVLSMKLLSFVGMGGAERAHVRKGFLASAGGILVSFLALAGVQVALLAAGKAAGWGVQFQHPVFLAAMVAVLTLFACNLWGWFELRVPSHVLGVAVHVGHGHTLPGHFFTGVFATLLATPCSAPFLGTAIGFALSRGPSDIFAVFAALGAGLATPYLLVAAVPGLALHMPRPGPWMVTLKRLLGLALVATALWLLGVLGAEIDALSALGVGAAMVAVAALLWARPRVASPWKRFAWPAVSALILLAIIAPSLAPAGAPSTTALAESGWRPFDEAAIHRLTGDGRVVFVDVTADWCITCAVNKRLVLDRETVTRRLFSGNVVAMRADWTNPDPQIAAYLKEFGRYGIPFNAVYGPGAPGGIALPELLTEQAVLTALEQAAAGAPPKMASEPSPATRSSPAPDLSSR
jgi:suppressor for copper-sensitivity B